MTKNSSKNNEHQSRKNFHVSISYFAKFLKAKVDKKRSLDEIKDIITVIDIDKDNKIGESDLETFLSRVNF